MVIRAQAKQGTPPRSTVQTLGGRTYAIPQVAKDSNALAPFAGLLMLPIMIPSLLLLTGVMFLGPSSLRNKTLSRIIPMMMSGLTKKTENQRKLLLQHVSGRVLDVGCGSGAYLPLLKGKASHIVALEPVPNLHPIIRKKAAEAGFEDYQVTVLTETLEQYAASNPSASFDWVILGNVLCEVGSVESTLNHVHLLLKNGGHVYFSEHVGAPEKSYARKIQNTVNPWWRRVSGGCNCNRDSLHALQGMADWEIVYWDMENIKVWFGSFVMGLARKVQADV